MKMNTENPAQTVSFRYCILTVYDDIDFRVQKRRVSKLTTNMKLKKGQTTRLFQ